MSEENRKTNIQITKTDYLNFRFCRKNLWLQKNRPDEFGRFSLSEFELELVKEGQEVDRESQNLFPEGVVVSGSPEKTVLETKKLLGEHATIFQGAILHDYYYIRTDILKWNEKLSGYELYEVKATTKVKTEKFNNHIYDLAFQYCVCKIAGIKIVKLAVIHLDAEYQKFGEINYDKLFKKEDVTKDVLGVADEVAQEMSLMIGYLSGPEEKYCQCRYRTRNDSNHCTTFDYSNPDIPEYAVHDVTRINSKKLGLLIESGVLDIKDIPEDFEMSDTQKFQVDAAKRNKPHIDTDAIEQFLKSLVFPLYLIDYESYLPAIPRYDRYHPYQNIVFQYSLHIMDTPGGEVRHTEFLATENREPSADLVEKMKKDIGRYGTILVWHKPFEMGRNREMAKLNPTFEKFLEEINDRVVDLKEVFSKNLFVHPKFCGSASIKKVMPVLIPELSYKHLAINNGADANKQWGKMINGEMTADEKTETIRNLLTYCKQDTFAMVRIYQYLTELFH